MTYLTTRQIQLEENKILDDVIEFLKKNNLKYFLCGGTLLGCIRHNGFIPWDDDIDIAMPRTDYDKLQKILKENTNKIGKNLYFHSYELGNLNLPFTKVYNHEILINDYRYNDKYEKYLWIDIFPIDGLASDNQIFLDYKKLQKIKYLLFYRKMTFKFMLEKKEIFLKKIAKIFFKLFLKIIPEKYFAKKIIKLSQKYPYDTSEYVGCYVWGYGPCERFKKEVLETYDVGLFENKKYTILKYYDEYLTGIYGDYMTLPPEDKRVTHSFKAWRVEANEEEVKK